MRASATPICAFSGANTANSGASSVVSVGERSNSFYLGAQVAWGPIAQELKLVIIGVDETKSGTDMFTVLGIKWSPIVVRRDFELPVSDGTKVKFVGTV